MRCMCMKTRKIRLLSFFSLACLLILFSGFWSSLSGQTRDTTTLLPPDLDLEMKSEEGDYPNPKKALLWAIIPGGGQIYNKSWIKIPFVYGGFFGMYKTIEYNQSRYRRLRDALDAKRKGEEHEFSGTAYDNENTLYVLRNQFDKSTQLSYIGMVAVYFLQGLDAFVTAHLNNFDIDEDISYKIKPALQTLSTGETVVGIGVNINLNKSNQEENPRQLFLAD